MLWPENHTAFTVDQTDLDDSNIVDLVDISLGRVGDYIKRNSRSTDFAVRLRLAFLHYLRSIFLYNSIPITK